VPPIASGGTDTASTLEAMAAGGGGGGPQGPGPGGADQRQAQVEQAVMAIRELQQKADALAKQLPSVQAEVQQMKQIFQRMVIKAGQMAPNASPSEAALPGGA
jgi:multidrug resistance efflux pump